MQWFRHAADWFALSGRGYQFWSGIGSGSPLIAGVLLLHRKHNCHHRWCPFVSFRAHPDDPEHMLCRWHHRKTRNGGAS